MSAFGFIRRAGFLLAAIVMAACSSKLSLENYNKISTGQTFDEVKQILGDPARCDEALGVRTCVWGDEQRGINVNFLAGQVVLHSARNLK
jgi:hypothetical protein